jgi:DNA-binding IclR family transcriptional regulator
MGTDNKTKPIAAVETTTRIINQLKEGKGRVTEIANELDLPNSTVHSHLSTLEQNNFLVKNGERYELSLRFLELGEIARNETELYEVARPEVDELAEETGEIASLMIEQNGKGVFVYRAEGEQTVHLDSYSGFHTYLHTTALGKAIFAHLPDKKIDQIIQHHGLPQKTENTISDRDAIESEFERIRENGVAYDDEERLRGFRAVAAPILTDDKSVIGSVSLAGPTNRLRGEVYRKEYNDKVKRAANVIELNVTYK